MFVHVQCASGLWGREPRAPRRTGCGYTHCPPRSPPSRGPRIGMTRPRAARRAGRTPPRGRRPAPGCGRHPPPSAACV
eukprot:7034245-Pyramimonas_sp.AAC.1